MNESKTKVAVIREELVAITGDYIAATILNQLIYWQNKTGQEWIRKGNRELSDELMLGVSRELIRQKIAALANAGYVKKQQVADPWDKRFEFAVDRERISAALMDKGFEQPEYLKTAKSSMATDMPSTATSMPSTATDMPSYIENIKENCDKHLLHQSNKRNDACAHAREESNRMDRSTKAKLLSDFKYCVHADQLKADQPELAPWIDVAVEVMSDVLSAPDSDTRSIGGYDRSIPEIRKKFLLISDLDMKNALSKLRLAHQVNNPRAYVLRLLWDASLKINITRPAPRKSHKTNSFNNFDQRQYDYDALEKQFEEQLLNERRQPADVRG